MNIYLNIIIYINIILYHIIYIYKIQCVRNFKNEDRSKLLLFVTGNSNIPVTGFKDLQGGYNIMHFTIKKSGTEEDLPKSHTWYKLYIFIFIY